MAQIQVLTKNKDFVAVDKPAGLSVHNNEDPTNLIFTMQKQLGVPKLYPAHRLDKETSGVQLLAFHETAARDLAAEFQSRSVLKIYVGVLRGTMKQMNGSWNKKLTDKSEGRKNPSGSARDRVECETRYKVLKSNPYFTYCQFQLITGRQHQIRKHTALENHALVGDPRYGDPRYNSKIADVYKTERMFLHCAKLEVLGQAVEAQIPSEFEALF
jgi:23S rRNA-/tRNA-specific pseudouridylate synthase